MAWAAAVLTRAPVSSERRLVRRQQQIRRGANG
jgi:hypothetical protein